MMTSNELRARALTQLVSDGKVTQKTAMSASLAGPAAVDALLKTHGVDEGDLIVEALKPAVSGVATLESTFAAPPKRKIEASVWNAMTPADQAKYQDQAP